MQLHAKTIVGLCLVLLLSAPGTASLSGDELVTGHPLLDLGTGLQASSENPARLAAPTRNEFALQLPAAGAITAWNLQTLQLLGETWTDAQREQVGAGVGPAGLTVAAQSSPFVGYRLENYAGRVGINGLAFGRVPKSLTDVAFYGLDLVGDSFDDDVTYTVDLAEVDGWAAAYLEAAVSAALPLPAAAAALAVQQVTAGATVKYLLGLAYVSTDIQGMMQAESVGADTTITLTDLQAGYVESSTGQGFAADLGISVQVNDQITVDASVRNLGSLRWTDVSGEYRVLPEGHEGTLLGFSFSRDPFGFDVDFDDDLELAEIPYDGGDITMVLPLELRLGVSYLWNPRLTVAGQVHHTRVNRSTANHSVSGASVAAEYRPFEFLPLRSSISVNSASGVQLNAGFGVRSGPVRFDASLTNVAGLLLPNSRGTGLGLRMGLSF